MSKTYLTPLHHSSPIPHTTNTTPLLHPCESIDIGVTLAQEHKTKSGGEPTAPTDRHVRRPTGDERASFHQPRSKRNSSNLSFYCFLRPDHRAATFRFKVSSFSTSSPTDAADWCIQLSLATSWDSRTRILIYAVTYWVDLCLFKVISDAFLSSRGGCRWMWISCTVLAAQIAARLMPRSHQTFRPVLAVKLLGIMLRNIRCWSTTFHTITAEGADGWC